jgi:hypothetical protein
MSSQATRYVAEFMLQIGFIGPFRYIEIEPEPLEDNETTSQDRLAGAVSGDDAY